MNKLIRSKDYDDFIDKIEVLLSLDPCEFPITHVMAPGMYCRSALMEPGKAGVSKIHKTEHFFEIVKGTVTIANVGEGVITVTAPYMQITTPGTRRIIYAHEGEEVIWNTFHPVKYQFNNDQWRALTEEERQGIVDEIENDIIEKHENPLLTKKEIAE